MPTFPFRPVLVATTWLAAASAIAATPPEARTSGFPADFPALTDQGGNGAGQRLSGFGGLTGADRTANRNCVVRRPVILVHGNGAHALHPQWGWETMRRELLGAGYQPCEIWALSYLGADNTAVDMMDPHRSNVDDLRTFVDAVRSYLDVRRVDLIGHSLGAGLVKAYMTGLQKDGRWSEGDARVGDVGTFVALAAGFYGLGPWSWGEFKTGSDFERQSHVFLDVTDDTPFGPSSESDQSGDYVRVTELDNGTVSYVALWAEGDFVDDQNANTGRLEGANLNQAFSLGSGLQGHERIIKDPGVFRTFAPFLNR